MMLKSIFLLGYLLITALLFLTFDATIGVWVSFFASALLLTGITVYHLYIEREYSPFISCFIVFTYLFFLVAPMVQINSFAGDPTPVFITKLPYIPEMAIQTNFFIISFNILFFCGYVFFKRIKPMRRIPAISDTYKKRLPLLILILAGLTGLVFIASFTFVLDEIRRPNWMESSVGTGMLLIWKKVFFLVPFGGMILCVQYLRSGKKQLVNLATMLMLLFFFGVLLFWFKNPLVEKRNALGPIYICTIFLFLPRLLNKNVKTLVFMFFSMIILFPLTAILTHTQRSFSEIISDPLVVFEEMRGGGITNAFNTLNYDAFFNIMATIDYVSYNGYAMGYQLLSAFLFFVPRSLWGDKPIGTGQLVGEHLIEVHDYGYSNLSNPLVSEGYINFGFLGILIAAIALAYVCVRLLHWLKSEDYLKKIMGLYLAIHLIFLLRGDFTNGFSYYIGTLVGVLVIPKCLYYLFHFLVQKQKQWKASEST